MDTDEAGKHTQNILARVTRQQEVDELTSRLVEISLSKPQETPQRTLWKIQIWILAF